jgi:hypothetical protein
VTLGKLSAGEFGYNRARIDQRAWTTEKRPRLTDEKIRWRWGALAGALMSALALFPQAHLAFTRGAEWQGSFAYFYTDEPAYAAYLNALIDGRPRRNDPYAGRDDSPENPLAESLFSIQFAPAYLLALPARLFNLSASTVFILLMPLVAFTASLAVYWLAWSVLRDRGLAFAAVFVVLCLGTAVSGQGWVASAFGQPSAYVFLPFLRRYVPGVPLVFVFLFCGALWRALMAAAGRARLTAAFICGLLFAVLVYSYFYHWTAAAALAGCAAAAWLAARPERWRDAVAPFAVVALVALASLVPYAGLLSRRAGTMDTAQALLHTRAPDVLRGVILVAALTLAALAWGARRGYLRWRDHAALFTAALAASVVAAFNQQIVTGRSLQPMHYEQYVSNYLALLAAVLACGLLRRGRAAARARPERGGDAQDRAPAQPLIVPRRAPAAVALAAFLWGAAETVPTTLRYSRQNALVDDWYAVTRRLDALAREAARDASGPFPVVFNPSDLRMDIVPAASRCAVVWAPHTFAYSSLAPEEHRRRLFQFLHFSGVAPADFAAAGRDQGFLQFNLFGWERANPRLTARHRPVTPAEIEAERRNYAAYVASVGRSPAPPEPALSFVVVSDDQPFDTANLDRHYRREEAARVGRHTIFRARPR